jgi:hypothetical protein
LNVGQAADCRDRIFVVCHSLSRLMPKYYSEIGQGCFLHKPSKFTKWISLPYFLILEIHCNWYSVIK